MDAVENAVAYDYSNGFVEGIMYGLLQKTVTRGKTP